MRESAWIRIAGGIAVAATIASAVFTLIFALNIPVVPMLTAPRVLLFLAFALHVVGMMFIVYFSTIHTNKLSNQTLGSKRAVWGPFIAGVVVNMGSVVITLVTLVLWMQREKKLPLKILDEPTHVLYTAWFVMWGVSFLFRLIFFIFLGFWTKNTFIAQIRLHRRSSFSIHLPPMEDIAPGSRPSFCSKDSTVGSRTPSAFAASIGSTQVGTAYGSRIKQIRSSSKSSLDVSPFPAGEATSIETAFDNWDTSTLHNEMRCTVLASSPPTTKNGLEPIPGSRPESPDDQLDEPELPSSPVVASSEALVSAEDGASPQPPPTASTPPTSPPNFSRPTSKSQNKPFGGELDSTFSMQEIIHPLFRQGSPDPPPNAMGGTMVTASPFANRPITPKTLSQLRGKHEARKSHAGSTTGQWKAMPSLDTTPRPRSKSHSVISVHEKRPSTAGSVESARTATTTAAKSDFGSPGPSIYEEDELPPVLPGFVLSAGQRSSMIGYGKRKSTRKSKRDSGESQSAWRYSRGSFMGSEKAFRNSKASFTQ